MKLTCPGCGAFGSIEGFTSDAAARECIRLIFGMPTECGKKVLPYLTLFRPSTGRGLPWDRAHRLTKDLAGAIAAGHIQIGRKPARPAPSKIWAQALEKILETPPQRLPLKSHGYLAAVCYDIADQADRQAETDRNKLEAQGINRNRADAVGNSTPADPEHVMATIKLIRQKIGGGRK